jgi:hypothetical protein
MPATAAGVDRLRGAATATARLARTMLGIVRALEAGWSFVFHPARDPRFRGCCWASSGSRHRAASR